MVEWLLSASVRLRRVCGTPAVRLPYWPSAVDWLSRETGYSGVVGCGIGCLWQTVCSEIVVAVSSW